MPKSVLIAIFCALLVVPSFARGAETIDKIIAIVGKDPIMASDLQKAKEFTSDKTSDAEILEELINEKLIEGEIKRMEIEITPEELSQAIAGILRQNQMTLDELKAELKAKKSSYTAYKEQVSQNIKRMKFIGRAIYSRIVVTDEDIENLRKTDASLTEEQAKRKLYDLRGHNELDRYLNNLRQATYIDILK